MADWRADAGSMTFTIRSKELETLRGWLAHHECAGPGQHDLNLYPFFTYEFSPGGVGTYVNVHCSRCGKKQDLTDVSDW